MRSARAKLVVTALGAAVVFMLHNTPERYRLVRRLSKTRLLFRTCLPSFLLASFSFPLISLILGRGASAGTARWRRLDRAEPAGAGDRTTDCRSRACLRGTDLAPVAPAHRGGRGRERAADGHAAGTRPADQGGPNSRHGRCVDVGGQIWTGSCTNAISPAAPFAASMASCSPCPTSADRKRGGSCSDCVGCMPISTPIRPLSRTTRCSP